MSNDNRTVDVSQQKANELRKQELSFKNIGERFLNKGKERTVAKYQYLVRNTLFFIIIPYMVLVFIALTYMSLGAVNLETIYEFGEKIYRNYNQIPLNQIVILFSPLLVLSTIFFVRFKKFIDNKISKQKVCNFAGIYKYRLEKIQYKPFTKLTFKLKESEKYEDNDLKQGLKPLLAYYKMFDGVIVKTGTIGVLELKMFSKEDLKDYNFSQIQDEDLKKKIIRTSGGINKFSIVSITDKTIVFKNKELETFDKSELESAIPKIAKLMGKYSGKLVENTENDSYEISFKNKLPTKEAKLPLLKPEKVFRKNQMYLGVHDVKEKIYAYTTENEENRGKLNGHLLTVGASGSGKSFSVDIIMKNWLNSEDYKDIEKIYILNFKDSADFNHYKKLDKVEYCGSNVRSALAMCKKVELEMTKRYIYNSIHNKANYPGQKILFIIDEIQTITEEMGSRTQDMIERNSWNEIETIMKKLASKSRAANMSLWVILQKGTAENLPGGMTFRDNIRNRMALKNNNMSLLLDQELIDKNNIQSDKLEQGQFVYMDNLKGESTIIEGFCQGIDLDIETIAKDLSKNNDSDEDIKIRKELEKYEEISQISFDLEREQKEEDKAQGKKSFIDNIEDLRNFKERDFIQEAIEIYEKQQQEKDEEDLWEPIDIDSVINDFEVEYGKFTTNEIEDLDIELPETDKREVKEIIPNDPNYIENFEDIIEVEIIIEKDNQSRMYELVDKNTTLLLEMIKKEDEEINQYLLEHKAGV